jgi:hypothetical protein
MQERYMTKKVIYAACSIPAWVDMAEILMEENNWIPCYWIGRARVESTVRSRFPAAIFHDHVKAVGGGVPPDSASFELPALDADLLLDMAYHEAIAFSMMDRLDMVGMSFQERRRFYHWSLRYWSAVVDHVQPDVYFNPSTPHQVYDYVLYILCRRRGIQTVLFSDPFAINLTYPMADFKRGSLKVLDSYWEKIARQIPEDIELSEETDQRLAALQGKYEKARHASIGTLLDQDRDRPSLLWDLLRHIPYYFKHTLQVLKGAFSIRHLKASETAAHKIRLLLHRDIGSRIWTSRLRRHYGSLARPVDLQRPFIYVALHFQPELSTSPEGSVFVDQFLMVNLLSKAVPDDWLIYVKEHPVQFTSLWGANTSARSLDYYSDLASLPNVRLVPLETPQFELIDNARAVASISGTSCWEAIMRGKPALVFGHTWYNGCEGLFFTPTLQECTEAIRKINQGYAVDQRKVRLFIQAIEEHGCRADLYEDIPLQAFASSENPRVRELVRDMARVIQRFINSNDEMVDQRADPPVLAGNG